MKLEKYYNIITEAGIRKRRESLRFHTDFIFRGISFEGKSVLDIGGGSGIFSFYSAARGADRVVCLDPHGDGSSDGVYERFYKLYNLFGLNNIILSRESIQEYGKDETFDIIISHNSINHLDETACKRLMEGEHFKDRYRHIFKGIYELAGNQSDIVICDCSRNNIFPMLGLRNFLLPKIDWKKHQPPGIWAGFLREAGFRDIKIRRMSHDRLGKWGTNTLASFLYNSYFCIRAKKISAEAKKKGG